MFSSSTVTYAFDPSLHVPNAYLSTMNSGEERENLNLHMRDGSVSIFSGVVSGAHIRRKDATT